MPWGDICFLAMLLVLATVSFLPWVRVAEWAGMSMLGWMMALMMVFSPLIALIRVLWKRRRSAKSLEEVEV